MPRVRHELEFVLMDGIFQFVAARAPRSVHHLWHFATTWITFVSSDCVSPTSMSNMPAVDSLSVPDQKSDLESLSAW
jgi:hypothetical protein